MTVLKLFHNLVHMVELILFLFLFIFSFFRIERAASSQQLVAAADGTGVSVGHQLTFAPAAVSSSGRHRYMFLHDWLKCL